MKQAVTFTPPRKRELQLLRDAAPCRRPHKTGPVVADVRLAEELKAWEAASDESLEANGG